MLLSRQRQLGCDHLLFFVYVYFPLLFFSFGRLSVVMVGCVFSHVNSIWNLKSLIETGGTKTIFRREILQTKRLKCGRWVLYLRTEKMELIAYLCFILFT